MVDDSDDSDDADMRGKSRNLQRFVQVTVRVQQLSTIVDSRLSISNLPRFWDRTHVSYYYRYAPTLEYIRNLALPSWRLSERVFQQCPLRVVHPSGKTYLLVWFDGGQQCFRFKISLL